MSTTAGGSSLDLGAGGNSSGVKGKSTLNLGAAGSTLDLGGGDSKPVVETR